MPTGALPCCATSYGITVGGVEAKLQRCDLAQDVLGLGGVLHARQLHIDAIEALALHDGLGNAQLIDAVAQGDEVLLDGIVLPVADLRAS